MTDTEITRAKRVGNYVPERIKLLEPEIAARYAAGESARSLAAECCVSKNTVMRIAAKAGVARTKSEAGIARRDPNCTRKRRNDPPSATPAPGSRVPHRIKSVEAEIVELYKSGKSFRATGKQFAIGNTALRRLLARNGVAIRGLKETGVLRRTRAPRVPINPDPKTSIAEQVARHLGYQSTKGLSKNREFRTICEREYAARKPELYRKLNTRRAKHRNRIPLWADKKKIKAFYQMAADLGLTVDHDVPLQGKCVSGLHVESNLTLMGHFRNCRKSNMFEPGPDPLIGFPIVR